jgi:hypothetical protein
MPSFNTNTVHGLSADVYYDSVAVRTAGDVTLSISPEVLELTANDEGMFNPVNVMRRGETVTVGVPLADATGLGTISGIVLPFASTVSGASGIEVLLPKSVPGDDYLSKAKELRLVARDGSATFIFPKAVVTELDDLTLSEEGQVIWGATFRCFNSTVSGVETPVRVLSGSVITGP